MFYEGLAAHLGSANFMPSRMKFLAHVLRAVSWEAKKLRKKQLSGCGYETILNVERLI
jgi:hypothetical protein